MQAAFPDGRHRAGGHRADADADHRACVQYNLEDQDEASFVQALGDAPDSVVARAGRVWRKSGPDLRGCWCFFRASRRARVGERYFFKFCHS